MKSIYSIAFAMLLSFQTWAQSPNLFSFQGVARNASGQVLANSTISLRLSIHIPISLVYMETHVTQTSANGIFTVNVGGGQVVSGGAFADINWHVYDHYLQVEIDPAGDNNYIDLGKTQLVSVPYSLQATNSDHAFQSDRWKYDDAIVQKGETNVGSALGAVGTGSRLIWYPRKAAFRAGGVTNAAWDDVVTGRHSASFGLNTMSSGDYSVAMGQNTFATGNSSLAMGIQSSATGLASLAIGDNSVAKESNSVAMGEQVKADGQSSFATGSKTWAVGESSVSLGQNTIAKTFASTTFGAFNNIQDNPSGPTKFFANSTDRIFQIGNGLSDVSPSNALTVLRNGNVGLGNNALVPQFILDIGSRARIRHNLNLTAGLWFNNSNQVAEGFVGMKTDDQVGFYNGSNWNFWVTTEGYSYTRLGIILTSDRRLKRDFSTLNNSLNKITNIKGYHYFMKDQRTDQSLQTGVIAQEVEAIFPELVKTDGEGMKSVNYIGFIPHLIESVKELKAENEGLRKSVKRIESLEASLNSLIGPNKTVSVKFEQSK
ncbi:MAG: tail fiber domain-containing protein [Dyadobacter sp.]|uniref:tail fiber domain-containing protein n=1 Tax=Dyadobacter sp. TaxID=1914288 RepID=UPI003267DDFD